MSTVAALQLFALATLVLATTAGLAVSMAAPWVTERISYWQPDRRFSALLLLSLSPAVLALTSFLAAVGPAVLALVNPSMDHCVAHGHGHTHLCFVHLPLHAGGSVSWVLLAGGLAWILGRAAGSTHRLSNGHRMSKRLRAMGTLHESQRALVLPVELPLCVTVGLMRPQIVISESLIRGVSAARLDVILRHEEAHVRRHDAALRLLARMATVFMVRSARKRLLDELELAAEQSCDEKAAVSGDRLGVAETILHVERMLAGSKANLRPLAMYLAEHALDRRIASLTEAPTRGGRTMVVALVIACAITGLLAASRPLHHATETFLGALTHLP